MRITTMDQGDATVLSKAILVYQSKPRYASAGSGDPISAYATIHPITANKSGPPIIGPGTLLKHEALEAAMIDLAAGAGAKRYRFIDVAVLASGPGMTAWFTPARTRHMIFDGAGIDLAGAAAQPAMMWVATTADLFVFALGADTRPTQGSAVFHAPHLNVWKGGRLCQGSAQRPTNLDPASWEQMFYESAFTHPNDGANWQTRHRGGPCALWRKLLKEKGKNAFPAAALAPTGATVEQTIDAIMSTGARSAA